MYARGPDLLFKVTFWPLIFYRIPINFMCMFVLVDTSLKKPVAVGSLLRLEAKVDRREGARKVWIVSVGFTCRINQ